MTYKVYADAIKIYDSRLDKYKIFDAKLNLELNKTGAFTFTIFPDHPNFYKMVNGQKVETLEKMKSVITVYQDDYLLFRGRVLNEEQGWYNEMQVTCEGELAFLLDSVIRPYGTTEAPWTGTPAEYLQKILTEHNGQVDAWKQFQLGVVTVTDGDTSNDANQIQRSDTEYKTSWDLIATKLVAELGGYLWVRHEANGNFIDYLDDFGYDAYAQKIEFGINLLDLKKTIRGEDVMSAIIPLGAKIEGSDQRVTINEVNDNLDYIFDQDAVDALGWIFKTVIWDDVTEPANLKTKAQAYLSDSINFPTTLELTAVDLAGITDVNPFRLGRKIIVKSDKHGLDTLNSDLEFLVHKLSLDILKPTNNKLTVGTTYETLTESTTNSASNQAKIVEKVDIIEKNIQGYVTEESLNEKIAEVSEQNSSAINQSSTEIMTQVGQDYYLKEDADVLVESTSTQFRQTTEEFELKFNEFSQDMNALEAGADARFNEISKYIRFVDGDIILGEDGNELTLKIENDRIAFLEGGVEVAYFSNRKLYVNDGEFINSLALGNFAFVPRANGNVSFKKVK